jgi:putative oxygen-independent coproporphyrinogen III oxidase
MTPALGLYVHWPYCARICPYCDFNVYRARGDDEALVDAICSDLAAWREMTGPRTLHSVHFGGGTPSLLSPAYMERLIETAERLWGFEAEIEIGLEGNPNDHARFAGLADAGINRMSLGVQSFNDTALKGLGRDHDGDTARHAIDAAQAAFARVSFDMIYALEGQSLMDWRADLEAALSFETGHLSLYQLTIEPGTAFERRVMRGDLAVPDSDLGADLYELTQELCAQAGLTAYEVSNHARTPEDRSRHNRLYWRGEDWIGVGPGAHGRLGAFSHGNRLATEAVRRPADYIAQIKASGRGYIEDTYLTAREEAVERVLMGLRVVEGLDRNRLRSATGLDINPDTARAHADVGLLEFDNARVALTTEGRLFADRIASDLTPD